MQIEKCKWIIGNRKKPRGVALVDWVLVAAVVALPCLVVLWVISSPSYWTWCLDRLDMRGWDRTVWIGVAGALLAAMLLIRVWPEGRRKGDCASPNALTPCPSPADGRGEICALTPCPSPVCGRGEICDPTPGSSLVDEQGE